MRTALQLAVIIAAAIAGTSCRSATTQPVNHADQRRPQAHAFIPSFEGPAAVWTPQVVADPEFVHMHVAAATTPGAFLVPWVEGVTFGPCRLRVLQGDALVQDAQLAYDASGRLALLIADGPRGVRREQLRRNEHGQLIAGHGFAYEYSGTRLERLRQNSEYEHVLEYDDQGRLITIRTRAKDEPVGEVALVYADERLVERRSRSVGGEASQTYFTYDPSGRLVRVDVRWTDGTVAASYLPSLVLEYDNERLTQFGRALITYDDKGRVRSVADDAGTHTSYEYDCGSQQSD